MTRTTQAWDADAAHGRHGSRGQRAGAAVVSAASWLACRLPERPLIALSELAGEAWYRLDRARAAQARRNLRRVSRWLAASGLGSPGARAAAGDAAALERLVRSAFRHYARYYLDLARTPALTPEYLHSRLVVETPEVIARAFASGGPAIFVGLHFGSIELMAYVAAVEGRRTLTTTMETIDDPPLQRYFERSRSAVGIRIVDLRVARRELGAALGRGESVGLVADRDLTGGGMTTDLFGAPASLPLGPALLAVQSGAPTWVATVRRAPRGRYVGRLEPVVIPTEGTLRERVTATVSAQARIFEREIAIAPDQWWAVFFPIWPDLEAEAGAIAGRPAES